MTMLLGGLKDQSFTQQNEVMEDISAVRELLVLEDLNGETGRRRRYKVIRPYVEKVANDG